MGRGIAYRYQHFMLFDNSMFSMDETYAEDMFEEFKENILEAFQLDTKWDKLEGKNTHVYLNGDWQREAYYIAGDDHLRVGIDTGGDGPCLFVEARKYNHNLSGEEKEYLIRNRVKKAFNKLIKGNPAGFFSYPTSAWTAQPLLEYK
jgi:hypothetical protein